VIIFTFCKQTRKLRHKWQLYLYFTPVLEYAALTVLAGKRGSDKTGPYRRVLEQLPPVNYLTTRKLIGHLHFIHEQREKNLMPVENLAAIWGPTLMHIEVLKSLC
jgi:hypothetical protein